MRVALIPRPIRRQLPLKSLFIYKFLVGFRDASLCCLGKLLRPDYSRRNEFIRRAGRKNESGISDWSARTHPSVRPSVRPSACSAGTYATGRTACVRASERATYFQPAPINQATAANQLKLAAAGGARGDILLRSSRRAATLTNGVTSRYISYVEKITKSELKAR